MSKETLAAILASVAPGKFPVADAIFARLCEEVLAEELRKHVKKPNG